MTFFETSTHNLLTCEAAAGVGHHVVLSVAGTGRLLPSGRVLVGQEGYFGPCPVCAGYRNGQRDEEGGAS